MILPLLKKELKASRKILFMFMALLSMYAIIIVAMYDPSMASVLDMMAETMPDFFAAFSMTNPGSTILEFVANYLYGFILVVIPMIFTIIMSHRLMGRYLDKGSMAYLLATPYKRSQVFFTQWAVLMLNIVILLGYASILIGVCMTVLVEESFSLASFCLMNVGLLCLHLCLASGCYLSSCSFDEAKWSVGFGAGACVIFVLIQMLSQVSDKIDFLKYLTPLTLFDAKGLINGDTLAIVGMIVLLAASLGLLYVALNYFKKRDLSL